MQAHQNRCVTVLLFLSLLASLALYSGAVVHGHHKTRHIIFVPLKQRFRPAQATRKYSGAIAHGRQFVQLFPNMKLEVTKEFLHVISRIKCTGAHPPCFYLVEFGWDDLRWWNSQEVYDDIDRYAVVMRHISELYRIMYHTVCLPGKILKGYCADVTLCSPHIIPLKAMPLLFHQAEQERRYLMKLIDKPVLIEFFSRWKAGSAMRSLFQ